MFCRRQGQISCGRSALSWCLLVCLVLAIHRPAMGQNMSDAGHGFASHFGLADDSTTLDSLDNSRY